MGSRRHNSSSLVGDMVDGQIAPPSAMGSLCLAIPILHACTSGNLQDVQAVLSGSKTNCQRRAEAVDVAAR
jgi:hypothetical protein